MPNLRKCESSVNKAEAAPLQFSPHRGGVDSISGESVVSLRLAHSKGSERESKRGRVGVRECVHVCRSYDMIHMMLQYVTAVIHLNIISSL